MPFLLEWALERSGNEAYQDGLEKLIVNGSVIWQGEPAPYIADDHYDDVFVERSER